MAGQPGENPIADAAAADELAGPGGVWERLAERLRAIPGYVERFIAVYDDVSVADDITFVHAANAIAAFEALAWRADDSRFDRHLRGDRSALSLAARRGLRIFYQRRRGGCASCHGGAFPAHRGLRVFYDRRQGGCASCHSGSFQTDHSFRAIAAPQIGPGKGDGASGHEDFGRERVTGDPADRYRFRVPTLRNVALTAPYGHSGAFATLEAMVRHHLDTVQSLESYDRSQVALPARDDLDALDFSVMDDPALRADIAAANELEPIHLTEEEIANLIEFLHALTDPGSLDLRRDVPTSVPSGLPLFE
jgi:cytochrome c peroxidase